MIRGYIAVALCASMLAGCDAEPTLSPESTTPSEARSAARSTTRSGIPDQFVVVLKPGADLHGFLQRYLTEQDSIRYTYRTALVGFTARLSPAALRGLERHPDVLSILSDEVGTPDQSATWGLDRIDQRALPLDGAFAPGRTGAGVNVYVVDSGIRKSHREFDYGARSRHGYTAISDGRGSSDCHGHGTHVAAIATGSTLGVARGAVVHAVRIADCSGNATVGAVLAGLDWIAANAQRPAVVNVSYIWSARSDIDQAVKAVLARGITVFASAGNSDADACKYSPGRVSGVITVGNATSADSRYSTSNWGSCVHLFAPGTQIVSAWSGSDTEERSATGTSMSSPFAAGVAALYLQGEPMAGIWIVRDAILGSGTVGVISDVATSANRLLYARPASYWVWIEGPSVASAPAYYHFTATTDAQGPVTYAWSTRRVVDGSTATYGTASEEEIFISGYEGDIEVIVDVTHDGQTRRGTHLVQGAAGGSGW